MSATPRPRGPVWGPIAAPARTIPGFSAPIAGKRADAGSKLGGELIETHSAGA